MVRLGVLIALLFVRLLTPPVCFCHCHSEECSHQGGSHPHIHASQLPFLNHDDDETDDNCPLSDAVEVSDDFYLATAAPELKASALPDLSALISLDAPAYCSNANRLVGHAQFHSPGPPLILSTLTSVQVLR